MLQRAKAAPVSGEWTYVSQDGSPFEGKVEVTSTRDGVSIAVTQEMRAGHCIRPIRCETDIPADQIDDLIAFLSAMRR